MYKIILDGITGVCPQGAVDYYQSQWQNAHRSACQFSAQDSICLEDAANKQAAACEERYNGAQAAMTLSSSAEYGGTSYATGYGAMAVFLKDLIEQGTCPDNEKYRGLITEYEQNDATAQQQAADAEQQRVRHEQWVQQRAAQRRAEREYEEEEDSSPSFIESLVPVMGIMGGALLQQRMQQQAPSGGGGSSGGGNSGCIPDFGRYEGC